LIASSCSSTDFYFNIAQGEKFFHHASEWHRQKIFTRDVSKIRAEKIRVNVKKF